MAKNKAKVITPDDKKEVKPKVVKGGGYKDPYSKTEWESKAKFLEMKLSHANSIFTKLHNKMES